MEQQEHLATDAAVRVVLLRAEGEHFAAGADLKEMLGISAEQARATDFAGCCAPLGTFPKPVVALVQGFALGGGCELVEMCDIVLAAENADYAELNAQYDRYVVPGLSEEEQNLVDRDVVLNLLQQKVMGVGHLSSLRMEKNTATVTCLGADLNEVSALVESLESDQRVAHVTVSTAQGENDSSTSATIQIVFAGPLDVEGDGGSKEKGAGDGAA